MQLAKGVVKEQWRVKIDPPRFGRNLILILIIIVPAMAYSQKDTVLRNNVYVGAGAVNYRFIDEAFSHQRVKYKSTSFALDLGYYRITENYFLGASLQSTTGTARAVNQALEAYQFYIQFAAWYTRPVMHYRIKGLTNTLFLGGQLRFTDYVLEDIDGLEELSMTFNHTLDLRIYHQTFLSERSQLEIGVSLPVVGFVKRAISDGGANKEIEDQYRKGQVTRLIFSGSKFSALVNTPQINVGYVYKLSRKASFHVRYQFTRLANNSMKEVRLYSNGLTAGFSIQFK